MNLVTQVATRLLKLPAATHPDLVEQADLPMTTSDGTVLLSHRWYPRGHETGLPTLFMRSPYGRRGVMAFEAPLLARYGYNVVIQSTRGTHGSGGEFYPFAHEAQDGAEALHWIHDQPWCDGRVATFGGSYCGYTQLATAATADTDLLAASAVAVVSADLRCLFKPYGAFALETAGSWLYGLDPQGRRRPLTSLRHMLSGRDVQRRAHRQLPLRETDVVLTGEKQTFYRDWVDAPLHSDYFDGLDVSAGHGRQSAPLVEYVGWFDIFGPGQLRDAALLLKSGRDVRVVVGPWAHTGGMGARLRDQVRFFDRTLRGGRQLRDERPVRVQLYGDKRWWALPTWPAPSESLGWFLTLDGELARNDPGASGHMEWVDNPHDPAPSTGGAVLNWGGPRDNKAREAREDVLLFTSPPLQQDVVVLGTPRVTARVGADVATYDLVVRLCVVDGKGVSRNVSDGMQRISGGEADVVIEMWPVGVRVRRGQRLRLQVAGSLHPLWARNLHSGEDAGGGVTAQPARQVLMLGPDAPAVLELPVATLGPSDLADDID